MNPPESTGGSEAANQGLPPTSSTATWWKLVGAALGLQMVLLWDVGALFLTDALVDASVGFEDYPFEDVSVMVLDKSLVVGPWALVTGVVYVWTRRTGLFGRMFTWGREEGVVVASLGAVGIHVLVNVVLAVVANETIAPQGFGEYAAFAEIYGSDVGAFVFLIQVVYYLFEALLVVFMIGLFQLAGDRYVGREYVPWGGIGLALTWGLLHVLMNPTLEMVVIPLAMGVIYLVGKKHVIPVFLAVFLVFFV